MQIWGSGVLELSRYAALQIWSSSDLELCKSGALEFWKSGVLENLDLGTDKGRSWGGVLYMRDGICMCTCMGPCLCQCLFMGMSMPL